jgi:peptide/nickel transport system ATP-binding protein
MSLLTVSDLSVDFRTATHLVHAVRKVSFTVGAGERVGLVGESGAGKTTTALALMRMIKRPGRIVGGSALLGGVDLLQLDREQIRTARLTQISYVPQGAMNSLNPVLRVREQILDGFWDHGRAFSKSGEDHLVAGTLENVGLPATVADLFPHQLSGGMKQRVCIGMAIAMQPKMILADEPTSALDVITQRQVVKTLISVQEEIGSGLLLIGHDMALMAQVADRVIVMRDGRVVEDAPVRKMFKAPANPYSRMLIESVPSLADRPQEDGRSRSHGPGFADAKPAEAELLAFEAVSKVYGGGFFASKPTAALEACSFRLSGERPQIISIVGQSGSGKTTLGRIVLGLEAPSEGTVRYRGHSLATLPGKQALRYRVEVQAVFQDPYSAFNPFYKVDRTLALPLVQFGIATRRSEIYERMEAACAAVGLPAQEVLGRFPHELSGGQRQRLMVARALSLRPRLIVADEPVSMVDASLRMTILGNLQSLKHEHGISIIYITHDLATAYQLSDYLLVLQNGRVVEAGRPEEVIKHPEHPYTKALVEAIPWPDPERAWGRTAAETPNRWADASIIRSQIDGFSFGFGSEGRAAPELAPTDAPQAPHTLRPQ